MYKADTPVRYIKTIGPSRSRELNKLGIHTVLDLLERQPLNYIFPGAVPISEASDGMVVIKATLGDRLVRWGHSRLPCTSATLSDGTGVCKVEWYGGVSQYLYSGMTAIFYGKMSGGTLQQPKWTTVESTMESVYGGQYGTHHDTIRAALVEVLANVELPGLWDDYPRKRVFEKFHFPSCKEDHVWALSLLKFDECLTLQLALAERRRRREQHESVPIGFDADKNRTIQEYFPYTFTLEQHTA